MNTIENIKPIVGDCEGDPMQIENIPFVVTYHGYPVRFNHNHCGYMYELTSLDSATKFQNDIEAAEYAARAGLKDYAVMLLTDV